MAFNTLDEVLVKHQFEPTVANVAFLPKMSL